MINDHDDVFKERERDKNGASQSADRLIARIEKCDGHGVAGVERQDRWNGVDDRLHMHRLLSMQSAERSIDFDKDVEETVGGEIHPRGLLRDFAWGDDGGRFAQGYRAEHRAITR